MAVASRPPFFELKARRKEYGGLEATATPAEVSFSNDPAVRSRWRAKLIDAGDDIAPLDPARTVGFDLVLDVVRVQVALPQLTLHPVASDGLVNDSQILLRQFKGQRSVRPGQMGHSSVQITCDICGHPLEERKPASASRTDELVFAETQDSEGAATSG